jgi:hypothetical protein
MCSKFTLFIHQRFIADHLAFVASNHSFGSSTRGEGGPEGSTQYLLSRNIVCLRHFDNQFLFNTTLYGLFPSVSHAHARNPRAVAAQLRFGDMGPVFQLENVIKVAVFAESLVGHKAVEHEEVKFLSLILRSCTDYGCQ